MHRLLAQERSTWRTQLQLLQHLRAATQFWVSSSQPSCQTSGSYCTSVTPPRPPPPPVPKPPATQQTPPQTTGAQPPFKRLARHSTSELRELVKGAGQGRPSPHQPVRLSTPPPTYHTGEFAQQWTRLEETVTAPYTEADVPKHDIFAVIQAGASQFKVCEDDKLFIDKLNGVDINDMIQFNRVLMCGTPSDTLVGRPYLPGVTVKAAVEEHIRDATVYIYKHRRAKGYRKFRGYRAIWGHDHPASSYMELTAVRILEISGTEAHGVEKNAWQEGVSTPLRKEMTLGERMRRKRKALHKVEREQDRQEVLRLLAQDASRAYGAVSQPFQPESEQGAEASQAGEEAVHEGKPVVDTDASMPAADTEAAQTDSKVAEGGASGDKPGHGDPSGGSDGDTGKK